jgi:hypothetical protein
LPLDDSVSCVEADTGADVVSSGREDVPGLSVDVDAGFWVVGVAAGDAVGVDDSVVLALSTLEESSSLAGSVGSGSAGSVVVAADE